MANQSNRDKATQELIFLLNELRAYGTPDELPSDYNSIKRHMEYLLIFMHRDKAGVDVLAACREALSISVQE